jgi:hypothetical protein
MLDAHSLSGMDDEALCGSAVADMDELRIKNAQLYTGNTGSINAHGPRGEPACSLMEPIMSRTGTSWILVGPRLLGAYFQRTQPPHRRVYVRPFLSNTPLLRYLCFS